MPIAPPIPAEYEQNPAVGAGKEEKESDQAPRNKKPDPHPAMGLERDRAIREDSCTAGERAHEMWRQIIDSASKVNRIVAHVRGGMKADDTDRGEKETNRIEVPRLVPRDRGPERYTDERGDEAVGLRRLDPAPQRGHPIPRPSGRGEAHGPR